MKYFFFTTLFNTGYTGDSNIKSKKGIKICKDTSTLKPLFDTDVLSPNLGSFALSELTWNDTLIYTAQGKILIESNHVQDNYGNQLCHLLLHEANNFLMHLWKFVDCNCYLRDGYLIIYNQNLQDGKLYKYGMTSITSSSTTENTETSYESLNLALQSFERFFPDNSSLKEIVDKEVFDPLISQSILKKNKKPVHRAYLNIALAQHSSLVPIKIVFYCSALEALFLFGEVSEITHKIAERVALYLENSLEERKNTYENIKEAYNIRSKILHGSYLSEENIKKLPNISFEIDRILRKLLHEENHTELENQNTLKKLIENKIFS